MINDLLHLHKYNSLLQRCFVRVETKNLPFGNWRLFLTICIKWVFNLFQALSGFYHIRQLKHHFWFSCIWKMVRINNFMKIVTIIFMIRKVKTMSDNVDNERKKEGRKTIVKTCLIESNMPNRYLCNCQASKVSLS